MSDTNLLLATASNLRVTGTTQTSITIAWNDNSNNEDGFKIYRWTPPDWILIGQVGANTGSYTDSSRPCSTQQTYIVGAYNSSGENWASSWIDGTTQPCVPNPPTLLSPADNAAINNRTVNFTWQSPNSPNQTGYTFRLSTSSNPDTQPWIANAWLDNSYTSYPNTFSSDGTYYWHMQTRNTSGQTSSWASRSFVIDTIPKIAIAAGGSSTCVLTTYGGVKCWGRNSDGQLGDGTTTNRLTPVGVIGLSSEVVAIAAGTDHSCALTSAGGVKCWGLNSNGQLGDGTTTNRLLPVNVIGLTSGVSAIGLGNKHSCAVVGNGIKCWGWNAYWQLGDGTDIQRTTPVDVTGLNSGASAFDGGYGFTCGLTNGGVKCWGGNYNGQLGDGTTTGRQAPGDVIGLTSGVSFIAAGDAYACALISGGVKCWGANWRGTLGDSTEIDRYVPVNVSGLISGVTYLAGHGWHNCALASSGVKCWGLNSHGELGDGTSIDRFTPVNVNGLTSSVRAIAAGNAHTCVRTSNEGIKCWGDNSYGQLGDGSSTQRFTPVDVVGFGGTLFDQLYLPFILKR